MTGVIIFTTVNFNYVAVQLNCHSDSKTRNPVISDFEFLNFFPHHGKMWDNQK